MLTLGRQGSGLGLGQSVICSRSSDFFSLKLKTFSLFCCQISTGVIGRFRTSTIWAVYPVQWEHLVLKAVVMLKHRVLYR